MSSWKEGGSGIPEDQAQEALLGVGSHPLYNFTTTLHVNSETLCLILFYSILILYFQAFWMLELATYLETVAQRL